MKERRCFRAEEKKCEHGKQQDMYYQLRPRVEGTKDDVIGKPDNEKPARPVVTAKHEQSASNCH